MPCRDLTDVTLVSEDHYDPDDFHISYFGLPVHLCQLYQRLPIILFILRLKASDWHHLQLPPHHSWKSDFGNRFRKNFPNIEEEFSYKNKAGELS